MSKQKKTGSTGVMFFPQAVVQNLKTLGFDAEALVLLQYIYWVGCTPANRGFDLFLSPAEYDRALARLVDRGYVELGADGVRRDGKACGADQRAADCDGLRRALAAAPYGIVWTEPDPVSGRRHPVKRWYKMPVTPLTGNRHQPTLRALGLTPARWAVLNFVASREWDQAQAGRAHYDINVAGMASALGRHVNVCRDVCRGLQSMAGGAWLAAKKIGFKLYVYHVTPLWEHYGRDNPIENPRYVDTAADARRRLARRAAELAADCQTIAARLQALHGDPAAVLDEAEFRQRFTETQAAITTQVGTKGVGTAHWLWPFVCYACPGDRPVNTDVVADIRARCPAFFASGSAWRQAVDTEVKSLCSQTLMNRAAEAAAIRATLGIAA